jgi:hypothetical protein
VFTQYPAQPSIPELRGENWKVGMAEESTKKIKIHCPRLHVGAINEFGGARPVFRREAPTAHAAHCKPVGYVAFGFVLPFLMRQGR